MINYDKQEIREALSVEEIFELLQDWGGEPEYAEFGVLSRTICHNLPGEGSKKLYYYENSKLFKCYTGCDAIFDIFDLNIKVKRIQKHRDIDLNESVRELAYRFGLSGTFVEEEGESSYLADEFERLNDYDRIQNIDVKTSQITLREYDDTILDRLCYSVKILPWLKEDISQEVIDFARIGYSPSDGSITIPHFDQDNRFIGLRCRTLVAESAEKYGKYRPLKINSIMYTHPLGMNLYGLNWAKNNIGITKKAIVFESEKSVLKYMSYFGIENNISVACCGSSLSAKQIELLMSFGAQEIIIAFDRQFQSIGDEEFQHLKRNLMNVYNKNKNSLKISFMFDAKMVTAYKASPIDEGIDKFLYLFNNRLTKEKIEEELQKGRDIKCIMS